MRVPFLILFVLTTLSGALAYAAARALVAGAGAGAVALLVLFAVPAAIGSAALVRMSYLDGRSARRQVEAARQLRRMS